jgi:ferredoxin
MNDVLSRQNVLYFLKKLADMSIIFDVVNKYTLYITPLEAAMTQHTEDPLLVKCSGAQGNLEAVRTHPRHVGVKTQPFKGHVSRDEGKCTQCSVCTVHCPSQALHIKDRRTMVVEFEKERCIQCEACIRLCPFGAMSIGS